MKSAIDALTGLLCLFSMVAIPVALLVVLAGLGAMLVAGIYRRSQEAAIRREADRKKLYREHVSKWGEEVAQAIARKAICLNMPVEALRISLGPPMDRDELVSKTRNRSTWKYASTGRNRYALRVQVENDVVVGWEDKR